MSLSDFSEVTSALAPGARIAETVNEVAESLDRISRDLAFTNAAQVHALTSVAMTLPTFQISHPSMNVQAYAARLLEDVGGTITRNVNLQVQQVLASGESFRRTLLDLGRELSTALNAAARAALDQALQIDWAAVQQRLSTFPPDDEKELREALAGSGLLPAPTMPEDLAERVLNLHRHGRGASPISNAVSGQYSRSDWQLLEEVHRDWPSCAILSPHSATLEQASEAMRRKMYRLVAPSLVPLVEGIGAAYLSDQQGRLVKVKHGQFKAKLEDSIPFWAANSVGLGAVMAFLDFLERRLFESIDFEAEASKLNSVSILNRHVLLHGRAPRHATRMNGLRSFLLLDTLGAVVLVSDGR